MRKLMIAIFGFLLLMITLNSIACTNFIFTKGSTSDGSTMITYTAETQKNFMVDGFCLSFVGSEIMICL